jgi:hypothetical protein
MAHTTSSLSLRRTRARSTLPGTGAMALNSRYRIGAREKKPRVWACNHCKSFHSYTINGSTHIKQHLQRAHRISDPQAGPRLLSVAERMRQAHSPALVDSRQLAEGDETAIKQRKFEEALVAFLCCVHIAFNIVENEFFVALLTTASNILPEVLASSHNTVRD